jgi:hypothetical protein
LLTAGFAVVITPIGFVLEIYGTVDSTIMPIYLGPKYRLNTKAIDLVMCIVSFLVSDPTTQQ